MSSQEWSSRLEAAIGFALRAHRGQKDRYERPYILHPLHLMGQFQAESEQIVAVLHDIIEDTDISLEQLCSELDLTDEEATAIDLLTHRPDVPYFDYVRELKSHPIARRVKLADLKHNMDIRRLEKVSPKDAERLEKYRRAWLLLTSKPS